MLLYKYAHPDRTDILANATIRFSSVSALNDPFELRPHISGLASEEYAQALLADSFSTTVRELYEELDNTQKNFLPWNVFLEIAKGIAPNIQSELHPAMEAVLPAARKALYDVIDNKIGVLCLSESPTEPLMWSHYADSHRGLVIEFDTDNKFFSQQLNTSDELRHLRKIKYSTERPSLILSNVESFDSFLTKSMDWEYEKEWKMLLPLDNCTEKKTTPHGDIHLFAFPRTAITNIILGAKASSATRDRIRETLETQPEYTHVGVKHASVDGEVYRVNIL